MGLFLEDLKDMTDSEVRSHIVNSYEVDRSEVDKYEILLAYESVGSWGCDSSSMFILRGRSDNKLYEVHGGHCSCYGFEGQFTPEESSVEYFKQKAYISLGGYDNNPSANEQAIKDFIEAL